MRIRLPANDWQPRDYQKSAWEYLEKGGKHCELFWHRRGGKDELALHWTAVSSFERVGNYWHMLPQANQARKAIWEAVNPHTGRKRIDEAFPLQVRTNTINDEMLIRFKSGATWQVVGSDNFNSLVGSPPIGLVFSEWPLCDPAAWAYLMPILEENGGWAIFNGTPRGKNHAYRSLKGAQKNPKFFAQVLPASKTPVFGAEQLDAIRQQLIDTYGDEYGQSVFDQEYGCSFDAANLGAILGRALQRADAEGRISNEKGAYDPKGQAIELSLDIGRRDTTSCWYWQPAIGGFRIPDHDKDSGLDADEWCGRIQKRAADRGYKIGRIWLPHDAKAKTFSAKHSGVEIFIRHFGADRVRIVPDATKADRINAARRVINRCAFHETNTEKGRDGLSSWSYVYDEERKEFSKEPDHNWASHDGDGFSYGAQIMEEQEPANDAPKQVPTVVDNPYGSTLDELWKTAPKATARI